MRILLALDGSPSADRALTFVETRAWPPETTIRVVAALAAGTALFGSPWLPVAPLGADQYEEQARADLARVLRDAAARLERPGWSVETELLRDTPARAIVADMKAWHPDLTVVGSRGHGPVEAALLGSTSAAVVDHAVNPVLVVRSDRLDRVLLAEDSSPSAVDATRIIATWPAFRQVPVEVLVVVDVAAPWRTGIAPTMFSAAMDVYAEMIANSRTIAEQVAGATVLRLRDAGLTADFELREGDPAAQILEVAKEHRVSLIAMGSRGHTGVTRLVLGSVAHNVLLHAPCSVLIVRHEAPQHA